MSMAYSLRCPGLASASTARFSAAKGLPGDGHSLSLFNERFLEARQLRGRHETCHDFNLAFINPVPRQCRHRPVGWLLGAVMGAAITAVATLAGWGLVALVTAGVTAGLFAAVVTNGSSKPAMARCRCFVSPYIAVSVKPC